MKTIYDINNGDFLKYYKLLGNIKNEWKLEMKTVPLNNETQNYKINQCLSSTHINKMLYNIQIENMKLTEAKAYN